MSRLSIRPRPLDIHKKLPIFKSVRDFEDDDAPSAAPSTRNSQLLRLATDTDSEVHHTSAKKSVSEIPTPQFKVVDTYERDYSCTFKQPTSYLRGRGASSVIGEFVEYDLDNEDEDWLQEFNNEKRILSAEKLETILFKLEILDHKTRERAGIGAPTFGSPVRVLLGLAIAAEAMQAQSIRPTVLQSVFNYWKAKRGRLQKPILRRLQPPPPVNDTSPYNVFRPREKAHRLHTRRMQRRENNVQSFEKLRQVRRNLDQAKTLLEALIKREEKKREVMENQVSLQRIQMTYNHEAQLIDEGMATPLNSFKYGSSEDDFMDSDDTTSHRLQPRPAAVQDSPFAGSKLMIVSTGRMKRELRRRPLPHVWLERRDPLEPVLLFTRPLDPDKLTAACITQPTDPPIKNGSLAPPYHFHGRIGRGGRIIFDRWNPLFQASIGHHSLPPLQRPSLPNG